MKKVGKKMNTQRDVDLFYAWVFDIKKFTQRTLKWVSVHYDFGHMLSTKRLSYQIYSKNVNHIYFLLAKNNYIVQRYFAK